MKFKEQLIILLYLSDQNEMGANKSKAFWHKNKDYGGGKTC